MINTAFIPERLTSGTAASRSGAGGSYSPTCATRNCCAACWEVPCNWCAMRGWAELAWGHSKTGGKWGFTPSLWLLGQPGRKRSRRHRSGRKDRGPRDRRVSRLRVCAVRSRGVIAAGLGKMGYRGIDRHLRVGVSQLITAVSGSGSSRTTGQRVIRESGREGQRWCHQTEIGSSLTSAMRVSRDRFILIHTGCVLEKEKTLNLHSDGSFNLNKAAGPRGNVSLNSSQMTFEDVLMIAWLVIPHRRVSVGNKKGQQKHLYLWLHGWQSSGWWGRQTRMDGSKALMSLCAGLWYLTYHVCSEGDLLQQDVINQNLQPVPGDQAVGLSRTSPTHADGYGILGFSLQVLHCTGRCSKAQAQI